MSVSLPLLRPPQSPRTVAHPPAAPRAAHALGVLTDSHGRTIRDLRLSITDRCNFRCVYCMDPGVEFLPPSERLTPVELERLARLAASMGVERIRLTGGEPALHPRLIEIIERIASIQGVQVAMTTNGSRASARAVSEWKRAGLTRLTFSLDSLSPERFTSMSRSNADPHAVIDAVRGAIDAGLSPVKINAVIVRCFNEEEIVPLAGLARTLAVEVRFIEFMPLDAGRRWRRDLMVPASEILERISRFVPLVPFGRRTEHDTAERYGFADAAPGSIGIIASVTRPFCGACSRLRITADGKVRPCLFSEREWGLMPLLRDGADDADLRRFLVDATWTKQPGHGISSDEFAPPPRAMYSIGG